MVGQDVGKVIFVCRKFEIGWRIESGSSKGPLILLVPEQYSMQAEKDLVQIAQGGAI